MGEARGLTFKSRSVRAPFYVYVAECLDSACGKAGVGEHRLCLPDGELEQRADPLLFADEQEFCTMEVQCQGDSKEFCCPKRDVSVGEGPVGVDNVGAPLAANANALEEPANNVGYGQQLQPGLVGHLAWGPFFVGQEFQTCGGVAEAVHFCAVDFVAL